MSLLVLFCQRSDLDVVIVERARDPRGDFLLNDGHSVLANDVTAKFLKKKGHVTELFMNGSDLRRCRRF